MQIDHNKDKGGLQISYMARICFSLIYLSNNIPSTLSTKINNIIFTSYRLFSSWSEKLDFLSSDSLYSYQKWFLFQPVFQKVLKGGWTAVSLPSCLLLRAVQAVVQKSVTRWQQRTPYYQMSAKKLYNTQKNMTSLLKPVYKEDESDSFRGPKSYIVHMRSCSIVS